MSVRYVECPTCHWNHYTGRKCSARGCRGKLRDTIVNFGDDLHERVCGGLPRALDASRRADLMLCLGSSLTVTPASDMPRTVAHLVICNLQATELDAAPNVAVRVFATTDIFMTLVLAACGYSDAAAADGAGASRKRTFDDACDATTKTDVAAVPLVIAESPVVATTADGTRRRSARVRSTR